MMFTVLIHGVSERLQSCALSRSMAERRSPLNRVMKSCAPVGTRVPESSREVICDRKCAYRSVGSN